MNICEDGHDEIVHNGYFCPLCSEKASLSASAKIIIAELEEKLAEAEKEIEFFQKRDAGND